MKNDILRQKVGLWPFMGSRGRVLLPGLLLILFVQERLGAAPNLDLSKLPGLRLQGEEDAVDLTGAALTRADFNQDGVVELVLAAPWYGDSSDDLSGRIYRVDGCQALSGKEQTSSCQTCPSLSDEEAQQSLLLATLPTVQTLTGEADDTLGQALAWVALDGDHVPALVVSTPGKQALGLLRGDASWTEPYKPDITLKSVKAYHLHVSALPSGKEVLWIEQFAGSVSWWRLEKWPSTSTALDKVATKLTAASTGLTNDPWSIAPLSMEDEAVVAVTDGAHITVLDVEGSIPLCQSEHPLSGGKLVGWLADAESPPTLLVYDPDTSELALAPFSWQPALGGTEVSCLAQGRAWQSVVLSEIALQSAPGSYAGELSFLPFPDLTRAGADALVVANPNDPGEAVVLEGQALRSGELEVLLRVLPGDDTSNFGASLAQLDLDGNQLPDLVFGAPEQASGGGGSVFILFDLVQYLDHDGDGLVAYRGSGLDAASFDCDDADPAVGTPFSDALGEGLECLHVDALSFSDEQWQSFEPGGCLSIKTQQVLTECPQGAFLPLFGLGGLFWRRRRWKN